jgi:hypothetical protein
MDKPKPVIKGSDEQTVIPPPSTATVDYERKPVLYMPDGKVLVRRAGF